MHFWLAEYGGLVEWRADSPPPSFHSPIDLRSTVTHRCERAWLVESTTRTVLQHRLPGAARYMVLRHTARERPQQKIGSSPISPSVYNWYVCPVIHWNIFRVGLCLCATKCDIIDLDNNLTMHRHTDTIKQWRCDDLQLIRLCRNTLEYFSSWFIIVSWCVKSLMWNMI